MTDRPNRLNENPSQTAGPYVHIGALPNFAGITGVYPEDLGARMLNERTQGQRIEISGTIHDGQGEPVRDAMIELFQADAAGLYPGQPGFDPDFPGFGRCAAGLATGRWSFQTIRPGAGPNAVPFVTLWIVARGINTGLHTRMYFPDDDPTGDTLIRAAGPRSATLIGKKTAEGAYVHDIFLQGPRETVFLDI